MMQLLNTNIIVADYVLSAMELIMEHSKNLNAYDFSLWQLLPSIQSLNTSCWSSISDLYVGVDNSGCICQSTHLCYEEVWRSGQRRCLLSMSTDDILS